MGGALSEESSGGAPTQLADRIPASIRLKVPAVCLSSPSPGSLLALPRLALSVPTDPHGVCEAPEAA